MYRGESCHPDTALRQLPLPWHAARTRGDPSEMRCGLSHVPERWILVWEELPVCPSPAWTNDAIGTVVLMIPHRAGSCGSCNCIRWQI